MRNILLPAFALLAVGIVGVAAAPALADTPRPAAPAKWEYRVLTREQVADLGNKDVAAGLNKLGEDGWELVAVEPAFTPAEGSKAPARPARFYLKRPKGLLQALREDARRRVAQAEADLEMWKDRLSWSERMVRKGYLNEHQVQAAQASVTKAQLTLDAARRDLEELTPKSPPAKERKPGKE